jgi:hypothetical protein
MAKIKRNPKAAFGLFDYTMRPKINRLLKQHGLVMKTRSSMVEWGDQVEITIEPLPVAEKPEPAKMSSGAWMQEWEESEAGWGCRPDGVWYYATEAAARKDTIAMVNRMRKREAKIYGGSVPEEYSRPCGEPRFVKVSAKLAAEILNKGRAFRDRRES